MMDFKRNEQGQLVEVLEQPVADEEAREQELHNELGNAQERVAQAAMAFQQTEQESLTADEVAEQKAAAMETAGKEKELAEAALSKSSARVDAWHAARQGVTGTTESIQAESDGQDDAGEPLDDAPDADEYQSEAQAIPTHVSTAAEG